MDDYVVWYDENEVQHLAHPGISHTICMRGTRPMTKHAILAEATECPDCQAIDYNKGYEQIIQDAIQNANEHRHKKPNMRTLWEEVSEATLAWRGKHEHPLRLELVQIIGLCINMARQLDAGEELAK